MNVSIFVTTWVSSVGSAELTNHFMDEPLSLLKSNPHVSGVEFYTAEPGDIPVMDDVPMPCLIVEIQVDSEQQARTLIGSGDFKKWFSEKQGILSDANKINLEVLEAVHFDVPGHDSPPPRTAPLSFVVRYYGPVANATEFVQFYTDNHPPILARFPKIRNVLCYLPMNWRTTGAINDESLVIGNEVVFDDLASFKAALESEVLQEAMADGELFASYGYSSHHAMRRELVYKRDN